MKINILLALLIGVVLSSGLVAAIDVSLENYYPNPVEAGDYFNLWLKVSNRENSDAEGVIIRVEPGYPFSLEPGEAEKLVVEEIVGGGFVLLKTRVRVDAAAREGDNDLVIKYTDCTGCVDKTKTFAVPTVESQTAFDVVLQEVNQEGVFIAVANIGKNPANAVTVRVPEQEEFKTSVVSASIVGNLESGDYTLVGFEISPKSERVMKVEGEENTFEKLTFDNPEDLLIQVDYTDPLGNRQSVTKIIRLDPAALSFASAGGKEAMGAMARGTKDAGLLSNKWFWISVVLAVVLIWALVSLKKKKRRL